MRNVFASCLSAAVVGVLGAGWVHAQAGADYEVACTEALAEQEGVEMAEIGVGPAEEVEGVMRVNLTLEGVGWICTLDDAGEVASLEQAT